MTDALSLHEASQENAMLAHVAGLIAAAGGWLPFDEYMRAVLYAPGLGYYSAGSRKFGPDGDFTTAPELSPLFGSCIAAQCEQLLRAIPAGEILELGAGSGRLAFDLLTALAARDCLPRRYAILEISADLRERQRTLLATLPAALAARVEFLDTPPDKPWAGVLVANEVLDALPCELFMVDTPAVDIPGVSSLGVGIDVAGRLRWQRRATTAATQAELTRLFATLPAPPSAPYLSEICSMVGPWIAEVTAALTTGVALFIDYGLPRSEYYHPSRAAGTLRCHYRQRGHDDPFLHPGMQDVTAWVDFTRVAEAADAAGLAVLGYATQAAFLLGCGIEALIAAAPTDLARARLVSEARQLLLPDGMGETFKVIALGRNWSQPLAGFAHQDLRSRL
ncbi:MAG: SAM-dependent methyltransferase [Pseudomonadota bacterium]